MPAVPSVSHDAGISVGAIFIGRELRRDNTTGENLHYSGPLHVLGFGPSGVGKGTHFLVPNMLMIRGKSIVVLDPKAQLAAMTAMDRHRHGDDVKIIDPFGVLAKIVAARPDRYRYLIENDLVEGVGYNPLASLDPDSTTFYDDAQVMAEAMIKPSLHDPHWGESAQGLLTGLIMLERIEQGEKANLGNVRRLLTEADRQEGGRRTAGLAATAAKMVARGALPDFDAHDRRTHGFVLESLGARFLTDEPTDELESVRSTADTQTRWLLSEPLRTDLGKNGVSFASLKTGEKPTTVYLILPSRYLETHSVWLRLAISDALQSNMTAEFGGRGLLLIMDEFAALGHLAIVQKLFGVTRDYGVQMMPIFQDLSQLKQLYPERWETLIANTGVVQSFRSNDLTTARWISERSGQETVMAHSYSESNNHNDDMPGQSETESWSPMGRPTIFPHELFSMQNGYAVTYWQGEKRPLMVYAPHYREIEGLEARALPNPYYSGR